jgi:hypothetical protein
LSNARPSHTGREPPLPGYDAHAQRLVEASQDSMTVLLEILRELGDLAATPPGQPLASQLSAWANCAPIKR